MRQWPQGLIATRCREGGRPGWGRPEHQTRGPLGCLCTLAITPLANTVLPARDSASVPKGACPRPHLGTVPWEMLSPGTLALDAGLAGRTPPYPIHPVSIATVRAPHGVRPPSASPLTHPEMRSQTMFRGDGETKGRRGHLPVQSCSSFPHGGTPGTPGPAAPTPWALSLWSPTQPSPQGEKQEEQTTNWTEGPSGSSAHPQLPGLLYLFS